MDEKIRTIIYWISLGAGLVLYAHANFSTVEQMEKIEKKVDDQATKEDIEKLSEKMDKMSDKFDQFKEKYYEKKKG